MLTSHIISVCMYSYVKLNFKAGLFSSTFAIWAHLHFQNRTFSSLPFYLLKSGQKQPKKAKNWISSQDPLKTDKTLISRWNPSFLGDVGLIKVVSEFPFGHPKCHFFVPEYGTKWLKRPFWGYQNPLRDTLGTRIGPRKVIFGHFTFFDILAPFLECTKAIN